MARCGRAGLRGDQPVAGRGWRERRETHPKAEHEPHPVTLSPETSLLLPPPPPPGAPGVPAGTPGAGRGAAVRFIFASPFICRTFFSTLSIPPLPVPRDFSRAARTVTEPQMQGCFPRGSAFQLRRTEPGTSVERKSTGRKPWQNSQQKGRKEGRAACRRRLLCSLLCRGENWGA